MNNEYIFQINNSINYILNHLDEELSVEKVADQCNFSKYYFNRLFRAVTGESVYAFIKRLRIEKSAFFMKIADDVSITEIAARYGWSSSNYSTTFKEHFGFSPSEYRKKIKEGLAGDTYFTASKITFENNSRAEYSLIAEQIKYRTLPELLVIYERYKGSYNLLADKWEEFCARTGHLLRKNSLYLDISYDDPLISDEDSCIYDLCLTVDREITGFNTMRLKGGPYAVYKFDGPLAEIGTAYQNIFCCWFPSSNCRLDDRRILSVYHSQLREDNTIRLDIYIPIK